MDSLQAILIFALAGFVSASFYTPLKFVKWNWEVMWIFYSVAALILCPMIIASIAIPGCWQAIGRTPADVLAKTFVYGALWGVGGLTFGLSMRYLGIGLGTAVALGFCSLVGTLIPPIQNGEIMNIASTSQGRIVLFGVFVCALGIAINGIAGILKEKDTANPSGHKSEFSLVKGFTVAIIAGVLSACMSLSMEAGKPIAAAARDISVYEINIDADRAALFMNSAILIVTLLGGFMTNFLWCLFLGFKNRTLGDVKKSGVAAPFYLILCALGGLLWYCQFFLYGMAQTMLDAQYSFASWAILMAFIIVFAGLIGLLIGEWKGTKGRTKGILWLGIIVLALSTFVMSYKA